MAEINLGAAYVEIAAKTDRLKTDLNKIKTDSETTARKIEQDFQKAKVTFDNRLMKMSLQDVETEAARLRAMLEKKIEVNANVGTLEALRQRIATAESALVRFQKEANSTPAVMHRMADGTNRMNMAMGQLGFLIGDADMFFMNFRMGMMSIANNVPMVVQGLMYAKKAAQETGQSFKSALVGSLMGPGGVMLAINALMFALNTLPTIFAKSDKAVEDHAQKVKDLADQYKNLSTAELEHAKNQVYTDLLSGVGDTKAKGKVLMGQSGFAWMGEDNSKVNELIADANTKLQALNSTATALRNNLINIFTKDAAQPIYTYRKEVTASIQATRDAITALTRERDNATDDKVRTSLNGKIESLNALVKKLEGDNKAQTKAEKDAQKDKEQDLKTYYDNVKWYDANYNDYLEQGLQKEIADLSSTITDKVKLHEYEIRRRKEIEESFWKWVEDNRPGLIERQGLGIEDVPINTTPRGRKPDGSEIYLPDGTMMPIDSETVRKQKEQSDAGFKNTLKEDKTLADELAYSYQSMGEALISSWSQSVSVFKEANSMLQQFINGLVQATTQTLALKVAQKGVSLLLNGPLSFLGLGGHDGGAFTNGVKLAGGGGFMVPPGFPNDTFPLNVQSNELVKVYTPNQQQANLRDYAALLAGINNVNASVNRMVNSLQAMNVNIVSQPTPTTRVYLDGKDITKNVLSNQKKFGKGGVNVD